MFNTIAYSSFGKASICSSFSAKSGSSTGNENLDSLLKTISKDPSSNTMANLQESLNDVNSIRYLKETITRNAILSYDFHRYAIMFTLIFVF